MIVVLMINELFLIFRRANRQGIPDYPVLPLRFMLRYKTFAPMAPAKPVSTRMTASMILFQKDLVSFIISSFPF